MLKQLCFELALRRQAPYPFAMNYDQQTMINAFREVMPMIRESGDPEGTLLKYASAQNYPPAVLEKLAQVYNTAKTIHTMEKAASPEDRGRTFPIIDTSSLLAKYVTWETPKSAAPVWSDDAAGWLGHAAHSKAASAGIQVEEDVPDLFGPLIGVTRLSLEHQEDTPSVKAAAAMTKRAQDVEREILTLRDMADEQLFYIRELFEQRKVAAFQNPNLVGEMYLDLAPEPKSAAEHMLQQFAAYLKTAGIKQCPMSEFEEKRIIREDRHKAAGWMEQLCELRAQVAAVGLYGEVCAKQAAIDPSVLAALRSKTAPMIIPDEGDTIGIAAEGAEPVSRTRPSGSSGDESYQESAESEGGESVGESRGKSKTDDDEASSYKKEKDRGAPPASKLDISQLKGRPAELKPVSGQISAFTDALYRQKRIEDSATSHLSAATVLQRLLLNDPILSKSDPDEVVSQFNTIRAANPTVALDPNLLTFALREAVQYGGMPLHTYDQLLSTRERAKPDDKKDDKKVPTPAVNLNLMGV